MKTLGIAGDYGVFDIPSEELAKNFIQDFFENGGIGLNITAPYKFLPATLRNVSVRPVNTMTRAELHNTDAVGLTASLKARGLGWDDFSNIVIIGAGATVITLLDHWTTQGHAFASINLLTRSPLSRVMRDYLLATPLIHGEFEITPLRQQVLKEMVIDSSATTLLINAASAVSGGDDLSEFAECIQGYRGFYQELTYGDSRTAVFKTLFSTQPEKVADGLSMLIEQARASQQIWWGQTVDSDLLLKVCSDKTTLNSSQDTRR